MIRTNLLQPLISECYEKNSGVSQTEPNQAMSVKEIIDRHTAGFATHVEREMYDDPETEGVLPFRDPSFDLADAYQMSMDKKHKDIMNIFNEEVSSVIHEK